MDPVQRQLVPASDDNSFKETISIEGALCHLSAGELVWLRDRLITSRAEVPDLINYLRAIVAWEAARRGGQASSFPTVAAVVAGEDVYCEDAIADLYKDIFLGLPEEKCAIDELLDVVIIVAWEMEALRDVQMTFH